MFIGRKHHARWTHFVRSIPGITKEQTEIAEWIRVKFYELGQGLELDYADMATQYRTKKQTMTTVMRILISAELISPQKPRDQRLKTRYFICLPDRIPDHILNKRPPYRRGE